MMAAEVFVRWHPKTIEKIPFAVYKIIKKRRWKYCQVSFIPTWKYNASSIGNQHVFHIVYRMEHKRRSL